MIKPINKDSTDILKNKFTLIYILNCIDILFTYTLLKTGDFYEANFIMQPIVSNAFLSILVKVILPAALIYMLFFYLKEAKFTSLKLCNFFINIVVLIYLMINFLHVYYIINIFSNL